MADVEANKNVEEVAKEVAADSVRYLVQISKEAGVKSEISEKPAEEASPVPEGSANDQAASRDIPKETVQTPEPDSTHVNVEATRDAPKELEHEPPVNPVDSEPAVMKREAPRDMLTVPPVTEAIDSEPAVMKREAPRDMLTVPPVTEAIDSEPAVMKREAPRDMLTVPPVTEAIDSEPVLLKEVPKESEPQNRDANAGAAEQAAPTPLTRQLPRDAAPIMASALDFDAANPDLATNDSSKKDEQPTAPEDTPVKEEVKLQRARDLPKLAEVTNTVESAAPSIPQEQPPQPAAETQASREAPAEIEQAAPSISFLVKIFKEANNLNETNAAKEKEQLGVAIEEISKTELGKLSLKPDEMSIKISEVDQAQNPPKDANDSTTYLVQIVKDVISQAPTNKSEPSIVEAIKIETALFIATKDLPKDEPVLVESIEHKVVIETKETPQPQTLNPITIQEVAKDSIDFPIDESNSITYLVQIVNDVLNKPPRYPHETETSIKSPSPVVELAVDRMNHLIIDHNEEIKLNDLTTSQISEGVDSLIDELNNQLLLQELEQELTSNTLVKSEESYDYNPVAELALGRPLPKDVNLNEVAHEIVISAVSGAQNKVDEHSNTNPQKEFNQLRPVEYITRDQPLVVEPADLPTFTKEVNMNVTRPAFTKEYHVTLNAPKYEEPQISITRPAPITQPPFSLTTEQPNEWTTTNQSYTRDLPTRDIPKVVEPEHYVTKEVVIDASYSRPNFNIGFDHDQLVTSHSKIDPYEILRAYSTTSTDELLRNFNQELPGARLCRITGEPGSESQFGVGFKENETGPFSILNVKPRAQQAGVREGDLIIAVNDVYVVGVSENELIVQFLEAKKSNELVLELIEPSSCPIDVRSVISY